MHESIPVLAQTQEEFRVHRIVQRLIEAMSRIEDPPPEESRRGRNVKHSVIQQDEVAESNLAANLRGPAFRVDPVVIAVDDVDLWICTKYLRDLCEASRPIAVIRIEPADEFTFRTLETLVDGVTLATILFRYPI